MDVVEKKTLQHSVRQLKIKNTFTFQHGTAPNYKSKSIKEYSDFPLEEKDQHFGQVPSEPRSKSYQGLAFLQGRIEKMID